MRFFSTDGYLLILDVAILIALQILINIPGYVILLLIKNWNNIDNY